MSGFSFHRTEISKKELTEGWIKTYLLKSGEIVVETQQQFRYLYGATVLLTATSSELEMFCDKLRVFICTHDLRIRTAKSQNIDSFFLNGLCVKLRCGHVHHSEKSGNA